MVPAVVGQQVSQAEAVLHQASLSMDLTEEFSESRAKGVVLRVEPDAGSELGKQSTVRVVVSKGKERYAVPKLVGTKVTDAGPALTSLTLRIGETSQAWSEKVPQGIVISQDPSPGASVKRNTTVSVVVSKGREPIEVPTVTGTTFEAAAAAVTEAPCAPSGERTSTATPCPQVRSSRSLPRGARCTVVTPSGSSCPRDPSWCRGPTSSRAPRGTPRRR